MTAQPKQNGPLARIGILNTVVSVSTPDFRERFGRYVDAFRNKLLGEEFDSVIFDVVSGEYPSSVDACDGYLITGSEAAVYEQRPWIPPMETFIRIIAERKIPLIGICFGHQLIAQALGGRVDKSPNGWGIGRNTYQISYPQPWMDQQEEVSLLALHEDQVLTPPQETLVILHSALTPFAGLSYKHAPILSFQAHPEFSTAYAEALLLELRGTHIAEPLVDEAIVSLKKPNDSEQVISWIRRFLKNPVAAAES